MNSVQKYVLLMFIFICSTIGYSQNVKITDFKTPISSANQMLVGGTYNWAQTGDSVTTNQFNVNGAYNIFYTSLPFSWDIAINANLEGKYQDSLNASYNLLANFNKYFKNNVSSFYYAGLTSNYTREVEFGIENRPEINTQVGLGYGRLTNATSMAKAIRIDEDLKKYGVIITYMPKRVTQEIANIIDRQSEYEAKYKASFEYEIIDDILSLVKNSDVGGEFINSSLTYFRVREVLFGINQFINPRYYGGDVRVGVGYTLLTRNDSLDNNGFMNIQGRYSIPFNIRQQLNVIVNSRTPFDSSFGTLFEGTGNINYSFNLLNRVSFVAGYTLNLVQQVDNYESGGVLRDFSVGNHVFNAGFNFYLENNITLTLTGGVNKIHEKRADKFTNAGIILTLF